MTSVLVAALNIRPTIGNGQEQLGSIAGVVVSDENPERPVRRAIVTVMGSAIRASRSAVSDDEGRFFISGLPAGSYTVIASRATFITSAYGALRPARLGTPVLVSADAGVTDLRLRLWRGGVLAGVVRNERGAPVEGLPVRALPLKPNAARYLSLTNNGAVTDEEGRFRIFGLEPGQYLVSATPTFAGGLASSALRDEYVDAVLSDLGSGGRGNQLAEVATAKERPLTVLYSPVYYPGTIRREDAASITVTAGQALEGLNVTLIQVPAVNVSGTILLPDGMPASGADVRLVSEQPAGRGLPSNELRYRSTAGPTGAFLIPHVPADEYEVSASIRVDRPSLIRTGIREPTTLWGSKPLHMSGSAIAGVVIQLGSGLTIEGRVRFAGSGGTLPSVFDEVRVAAVAGSAAVPRTLGGPPARSIARDGTFTLSDLKPNSEYRLIIDGLPSGWWPESAIIGGVDWLDGPLTVAAAHVRAPLSITVSDRPTRLSGTLAGESLVGAVFVVVFSTNRALWESERHTRAVQPDARGSYEFVNLPPAEYLVGAIGDVDPDDWRDPVFLERVAQVSVGVTLARGETKRLDLKAR